jgi:hypothetical protein
MAWAFWILAVADQMIASNALIAPGRAQDIDSTTLADVL